MNAYEEDTPNEDTAHVNGDISRKRAHVAIKSYEKFKAIIKDLKQPANMTVEQLHEISEILDVIISLANMFKDAVVYTEKESMRKFFVEVLEIEPKFAEEDEDLLLKTYKFAEILPSVKCVKIFVRMLIDMKTYAILTYEDIRSILHDLSREVSYTVVKDSVTKMINDKYAMPDSFKFKYDIPKKQMEQFASHVKGVCFMLRTKIPEYSVVFSKNLQYNIVGTLEIEKGLGIKFSNSNRIFF